MESGTLANTLAMCDFSGSMSGDPLHVSMALGLIIASCNTGIFKDRILTFDSVPTLHKFRTTTLIGRVNEVRNLGQGLSTDFQAAYNLVLHTLKKHAVPVGQEPTDLIVLTDMGWDEACSYGQQSSYTDNSYIPSCPSCSSVIDGNFNSSNRGYPDLVAWSSFVNVIIGHYYYYYYYYYYY
jgi:hypothetical protein